MLGLSLNGWENAMVLSLILAGFLALLVGVTTYAVVRLQRIELAESRQELERYQAEAEVKIEEARKEGIEAGKAAGDALVRAAQLEKDAANARLETEKIKGVVAWRSVPLKNSAELEKVLAAKPGSVNLRYTDGDPEALFLAIQISQILGNAHWQVAPGAVKPSNAIVFGIALPDAAGNDAQTLRAAFSAATIPFSTEQLPVPGVSFSVSTIPGAPTLMIGSRPPPALQ